MPTPADVITTIFTTENPATGSKPPPEMAWVVFSHGTAFFTLPTDAVPLDASFDALVAAARAALSELGPVIAGTPAADFNTARLEGWYPDEPVWFVSYAHSALATIIVEPDELSAGLGARALRQQDHDDPQVVLVRRFDGSVRPAA